MPFLTRNDLELFYHEEGGGEETVVFSHGFMMNHRMFEAQYTRLASRYRVIAFDHRGHGESSQVRSRYDMYSLVDDAAHVIKELANGPVHFVGMSTGGFIGVRLALLYPDLLRSLTLIDTSAAAEPIQKQISYTLLLLGTRIAGLAPFTDRLMQNLMADTFFNDPSRAEQVAYWRSYISALDQPSMDRFCRAIFRRDNVLNKLRDRSDLPPTMILVGDQDRPTPLEQARQMQAVFPSSHLHVIPNSGHTSPVEQPAIVSDHLSKFLASLSSSPKPSEHVLASV